MFLIFGSLFFNDTSTTEIYTRSLHDGLPIFEREVRRRAGGAADGAGRGARLAAHLQLVFQKTFERVLVHEDRKSKRLNSSHANIWYAVFCLIKNSFTN